MSNYQKTPRISVREMLQDQVFHDSIMKGILSRNLPLSSSIKLQIKSEIEMNYQLVPEDIIKILSFYGSLLDFKLKNNTVYASFHDSISAFFAKSTLHNKHLDFISSNLIVTFDESESSFITEPNSKYTCRFDIQIENERDFQVARRLIGHKGSNMKQIGEACAKGGKHSSMHDLLKIRLRGKGSGFLEGPLHEESDEDLHLCVSSKYQDAYKIACEEISKLILQVYKEYYNYCRNKGIKTEILRLKKQESIHE